MSLDPALALEIKMHSSMKAVREAEDRGDSEIGLVYSDAVVFIAGGTGFLGKQLIEKLLRSCRGIKKVYLLTRNKRGKSMEERLKKQLKDPVYDELRKVDPDFHKRIFQIEGDVTQLRLGLKSEDWATLTKEVNFIYHAAATVRFDEPLKVAILTNVRGIVEMMSLARECENLKAMVYFSTAYAHCNRSELKEVFYDSPVAPRAMIEFVETIEENKLRAIEAKITEGWPNTYTYSKAVAEEAVRVMGDGLPICIIRPSIVTPAHREPMPGWLDFSNCNGPSGVIIGSGIGLIRSIWVDPNVAMDLVPVDFVNNLAIVASWNTIKRHERREKDIKIYTLSRNRNKIIWSQTQHFLENDARYLVSAKAIWYCYTLSTSSKYLYMIYSFFLHYLPALVIDSILAVMGKSLRLRKVYKKVYKMNCLLSFFVFNSWIQHDDNTINLIPVMSKTDRDIFFFDVRKLNFQEFMTIWCLGLRKYVVKDGLQNTEYGKKKQFVLKVINAVVLVFYFMFLWKIFSFIYSTIGYYFHGTISFDFCLS